MGGDHGGGIAGEHLAGDSLLLNPVPRVPQEAVDIGDSHSRNDPLETDASVFPPEESEEIVLEIVRGSEVCMAALAGPGRVTRAIPEESRFAESGAGGDHALVAGMGART